MPVRVTRIDSGSLSKPVKLANGFLRADAYLTRAGVFSYRNPDGSVRREYRPPSEVFHADSLASMTLMPVTDDHPNGLLTSENAKDHTRGAVGDIRRDGDMMAGSVVVMDADLIGKLESGEAQECSPGYVCDMEMTPGVTPEGEHFDAIQKNIRYNHLAVVPRGRAGSHVRVRMDAENLAVILDHSPASPNQEQPVHKIHLDGLEIEVGSAQAAQAFTKVQKAHADAIEASAKATAAHTAEASKLQAKLDSAMEEIEQLKKDAAEAPAKMKAQLAARAALEGKARSVLGEKAKLDGLDEKAVQMKVLGKLIPNTKLDGKDDTYIAARFDAEMDRFESTEHSDTAAEAEEMEEDDEEEKGKPFEKKDRSDVRVDADAARAKMLKANATAWKTQVGARIENNNLSVAK